jgi:hypothetical protein
MFSATVKIDACKKALQEISAEFGKAATAGLNYGIKVAEDTAKALISGQTKKRTGNLLRFTSGSATFGFGGGRAALFSSIVNYASYIEEGTYTHNIPGSPMPKGKWLKFEAYGRTIFSKQIIGHPGNKAMPFMKPAALAAEAAMFTFLEQRAREITAGK